MDNTPFNSPDADVVLRTEDGASLRVFSRILTEASPFFRDLLTLPQPATDEPVSPAIVDVPEGSEVLHTLLRFVYPIEDPPVGTLSLLSDVLKAALKYDMGLAVQSLRRLLVSSHFVENEPSRVYAIACRHHLEEEAKFASTHTLATNILDAPLMDELKFISAFDYHRLLDLHRKRAAAAQKLLVYDRSIRCPQCSSLAGLPKWWCDWLDRAKEELQQKPTTDVIFSLPFLAKSSRAGCQRCGANILDSHEFLLAIKSSIDNLPATI